VQAVAIGAGSQQSAFGRAYLALEHPPVAPATAAPSSTGPAAPALEPPALQNPAQQP